MWSHVFFQEGISRISPRIKVLVRRQSVSEVSELAFVHLFGVRGDVVQENGERMGLSQDVVR